MVLMLIVTSVYSIVDGWFISNYAGSTAFAAMNIIWPAVAIISALGMMIGAGGSALVSKTFGEGDTERGNHIFTMLVRLTVLAGIVISAALFAVMRPLAVALGAEGEMVRYAVTYGRILTAALAQWTQNRWDNLESSSKKRRENLFIRFLHDVQAYCATERRIGFYSSRFNMTPKYFAKQINEISGRHASDWIRDHVILEAKAMLRTGNYSVGEVSDALHFPNSSFFGKYFKASVGVSPRQYMTQEK